MRNAALAMSLLAGGPSVTVAGAAAVLRVRNIEIPDGAAGIGYDDLQLAPGIGRVLVPAGRTGRLVLVDPKTRQLTGIPGFSSQATFGGGHGEGTTSACEVDGLLVATDRGTQELKVVDPGARAIVSSTRLAGAPDYVRAVPPHEVWVTEPSRKEIEVFTLTAAGSVAAPGAARLTSAGKIAVPDGPESLVVDAARGRAYTHSWKDRTFALDLKTRKAVATWSNGCQGARGIALDETRGFLFTGCEEGRATVLDVTTGRLLGTAAAGSDVDSIGYAPSLAHLYVPGGGSADLTVFSVSDGGKLTPLGKIPTARGAHTAAFDPASSTIFVGTPEHGVVLAIQDPFARVH